MHANLSKAHTTHLPYPHSAPPLGSDTPEETIYELWCVNVGEPAEEKKMQKSGRGKKPENDDGQERRTGAFGDARRAHDTIRRGRDGFGKSAAPRARASLLLFPTNLTERGIALPCHAQKVQRINAARQTLYSSVDPSLPHITSHVCSQMWKCST